MKNAVNEIFEINDIESAIDFVAESFSITEKELYSAEALKAGKALIKNGELFSAGELSKLAKKGIYSVLTYTEDEKIVGVAAFEIETGKILFLAAKGKPRITKLLIEEITQKREKEPDCRLHFLAFQGEDYLLRSLGFIKLKQEVFYFKKLRFVALRFSYEQIDVER